MTEWTPADEPATHDPAAAAAEPYVVVARRYRPQAFGELIGQQNVARALSNAIEQNRVGHAYLFTGARGVGKTSAARILAKALNCEQGPAAEPCQTCDICRAVSSGDDVDVLEIDGASNRGIDEIRDLRHNVAIRPSRARFKIYIIDEVHMLTREAFNALLKTLEEPPDHVKFVFCTTEPEKVPITIQSRCQRFDFAGIRTPAIAERLRQVVAAEGVDLDNEAIDVLARRAAGSMRDSQSLLEQLMSFGGDRITAADVHAMLGSAGDEAVGQLVEQTCQGAAAEALATFDSVLAAGVDVGQLLTQVVGYLRDCLVVSVGAGDEQMLYVSASERARAASLAKALGAAKIMAAMQILDQTLARLRFSTQERTLAELAVVRICYLSELDDVSEAIAELRSGAPSAPEPSARTSRPSPSSVAPTADAPNTTANQAAPETPANGVAVPSSSAEPEAVATETAVGLAEPEPQVNGAPAAAQRRDARPLTPDSAADIWQQALASLSEFAVGQGMKFARLETPSQRELVVGFYAALASCKAFCERPERAAKLEQEVSRIVGGPVKIGFETVPGEPDDATFSAAPSAQERAATLREKSNHPLVRRAADLFDARPLSVEEPEE